MRTILYSFIAIFIFGIMQPAFTSMASKQISIQIQAAGTGITVQQLEESAKIITVRLTDFSPGKFEVKIVPGKNRIQVTSANFPDLKMVENLITHKGKMAFYETYTRSSLKALLQENSPLFSLLPEKGTRTGDARIGCVPATSVEKIDECLKTIGSVKNCLFAWDNSFEDKEICLYALKTNTENGAVIAGSDIESVSCNQDQASKIQEINVTLKKNAVELWADVTKRNLNHAIAIVLDGKVLAAPVVRSEITGGKCIITGNYSETESRYIAALGNNGELPLSFKVVK